MLNNKLAFTPESRSKYGIFSYFCTFNVSCSPNCGPLTGKYQAESVLQGAVM